MRIDEDLAAIAAFAEAGQFDDVRKHVDPKWVREALEATGTATVRRRRLPAEQVVWLVIGMAMFRKWPIHDLVGRLNLVLPGRTRTVVPSTVAEAREKLGAEPLEQLFEMSARKWAHESARRHAWRGLAMYGVDCSTMRVADSKQNRDHFGSSEGRSGESGYPLTLLDNYSRYLLCCRGLYDVKTRGARATLEKVFRERGLPTAIRSDNGSPFASTGIHGLCALNVWWMKLGIVHQRIQPSSPQENGAHERMHRTLKAETTRPPAASMRGQQWKFDRFQNDYNIDRPHEALDDEPPASLWEPSPRPYPARLEVPEYPRHFELRRVSNAGHFKMGAQHYFISHALKGDNIGLEVIDDGLWNILYYNTLLGRLSERTGKISGASFRSDEC